METTKDDLLKRFTEQDEKLDRIYKSVEKTRKYFLWSLTLTLVVIVLPILGLVFVIPMFLKTLSFAGLGL